MIPINLDEYVSAYVELSEGEPIDQHSLAMDIADNVCAKGIVDPQNEAELDLLVKEIKDQLPYYL